MGLRAISLAEWKNKKSSEIRHKCGMPLKDDIPGWRRCSTCKVDLPIDEARFEKKVQALVGIWEDDDSYRLVDKVDGKLRYTSLEKTYDPNIEPPEKHLDWSYEL